MLKFLLGATSLTLAVAFFVGLGFLAHDGGAIPYQSLEFSGY